MCKGFTRNRIDIALIRNTDLIFLVKYFYNNKDNRQY